MRVTARIAGVTVLSGDAVKVELTGLARVEVEDLFCAPCGTTVQLADAAGAPREPLPPSWLQAQLKEMEEVLERERRTAKATEARLRDDVAQVRNALMRERNAFKRRADELTSQVDQARQAATEARRLYERATSGSVVRTVDLPPDWIESDYGMQPAVAGMPLTAKMINDAQDAMREIGMRAAAPLPEEVERQYLRQWSRLLGVDAAPGESADALRKRLETQLMTAPSLRCPAGAPPEPENPTAARFAGLDIDEEKP